MKAFKDALCFERRLKGQEQRRLDRIREAKDTKGWKLKVGAYIEGQLNRQKSLSPEQAMAIHLMTDFSHNFTYSYIAKRIGVNESTIANWRNDPYFIEQVVKEVKRRQGHAIVLAMRNVNRALARGSMKDTWQFLKMVGMLKEQVEITDNTGEKSLSKEELELEIESLSQQVKDAHVPSRD